MGTRRAGPQPGSLSVWPPHSHFTKALAASTFLLRALTHEPYAPTGTEGAPEALSLGNGSTPKSSPRFFCRSGRVHRPVHCIAVSPWLIAEGSDQSVGAPSSREPLVNRVRSLPKASAAAGSSNPKVFSLVR